MDNLAFLEWQDWMFLSTCALILITFFLINYKDPRISKLTKQNLSMRHALEFYAHTKNYDNHGIIGQVDNEGIMDEDFGKYARIVLEQVTMTSREKL